MIETPAAAGYQAAAGYGLSGRSRRVLSFGVRVLSSAERDDASRFLPKLRRRAGMACASAFFSGTPR